MPAQHLGRWEPQSEEWHAVRATGIGGSDLGVICGWSEFKTRDQLLTEKATGAADSKETKATERGQYCEASVLTWLAAHEGLTYDDSLAGTWADAERPWMLFNPDAITTDGVLVEAKTCAVRDAEHGWGRAGSDRVPLCYAAQTIWGMGILGLNRCLLGVLSGQPRFEFARYRITFDAAVFTYLVDAAERFRADLELLKDRTAA